MRKQITETNQTTPKCKSDHLQIGPKECMFVESENKIGVLKLGNLFVSSLSHTIGITVTSIRDFILVLCLYIQTGKHGTCK